SIRGAPAPPHRFRFASRSGPPPRGSVLFALNVFQGCHFGLPATVLCQLLLPLFGGGLALPAVGRGSFPPQTTPEVGPEVASRQPLGVNRAHSALKLSEKSENIYGRELFAQFGEFAVRQHPLASVGGREHHGRLLGQRQVVCGCRRVGLGLLGRREGQSEAL